MKKAIVFLAVSIFIISSGCEKEYNENNKIESEGEVYHIDWGLASYYEYKGNIEYTIWLLPQSISYNDSSGLLKGDGTFVAFEFISSSYTPEGSYSLPTPGINEKEPGQILFAGIVTWPAPEVGYFLEKEGYLDISKSGDEYVISYTGEEAGGVTVTAYYEGPLDIPDE